MIKLWKGLPFWGKCLTAAFSLVLIAGLLSAAFGAPVTLSWDAPTTNEDGSPLTDLDGYTLYWSAVSGDYSAPIGNLDVGNVLTVTVDAPDNSYFVVRAYDQTGNQSANSNEVLFMLAPDVPTSLRLGN